MVPSPGSIAVVCTCWRRPPYLRRTLASWARVRGVEHLRRFTMAVGLADELPQIMEVINESGLSTDIHMDSLEARYAFGMHRALGEAIDHVFADKGVDYVVCGEEDVVVSDDILEYFTWAFRHMRNDQGILLACAHNQGGTGWDGMTDYRDDGDAPQDTVLRIPYFNPWVWGIDRYHWEKVVQPQWDWDCMSGTLINSDGGTYTLDSGYDWNLHKRIIPGGGWKCLVPEAARSQTIGEERGFNSLVEDYLLQLSESFTLHRDPVDYKLLEGEHAG